jgi:Ni/Co efflux regulator RcnB
MKSRTIICAIAAASLSLGSLSTFAQDRDRGDHDRQGVQQRGDNHRDEDRRNDRGADRGDNRADHFAYGARGPEWRRGGRIPAQYRSHQYVVSDWRAHHLKAPPRGQQWVQVGGDYVLVAVATGIITQLLLNQ